jgi:sensor histidine kinase YesM
MKTTLTILVTTMSAAGVAACVMDNSILHTAYVGLSTILLTATAVGGIMQHFRQESVDFREVYREKSRMQKEKINTLEEQVIQLQKEIYATKQPTAQSEAESRVSVVREQAG